MLLGVGPAGFLIIFSPWRESIKVRGFLGLWRETTISSIVETSSCSKSKAKETFERRVDVDAKVRKYLM